MKKRAIPILSTLSLFASLLVSAIYARSDGSMRVDVPFSFVVGSKTLPPGQYAVSQTRSDSVIQLRSEDGRDTVFTPITIPIRSRMEQHRAELQFHRYGDAYFLSQVWISTDGEGCELLETRLERELIRFRSERLTRAGVEPEIVAIAAH
jgi:hypothetical protein